MYDAKILRDSVSPDGVRLTTFEVTFPRIVLSEFNTHRALSRNSASSRAIPVKKRIEAVESDPFIPTSFGRNVRGMQPGERLEGEAAAQSEKAWRRSLDNALREAKALAELGVHKQLANRLLEPFSWHTVIVTATEWDNFFHLRDHPDAQEEIRIAAHMMRQLHWENSPNELKYGEWHLPLVGLFELDLPLDELIKVCVGRCARISYLTHEGVRDPDADIALYHRLLSGGHMSPLEHAARPAEPGDEDRPGAVWGNVRCSPLQDLWFGNFRGWMQHRKEISREYDMLGGLQ